MSKPNQPSINRRDVLKSSAGALGAALGLDPKVFAETVAEYNRAAAANTDPTTRNTA